MLSILTAVHDRDKLDHQCKRILNLDDHSNQASVENFDSTHFFTFPMFTAQLLLTVPLLLQIANSLEDVSSKTPDGRAVL